MHPNLVAGALVQVFFKSLSFYTKLQPIQPPPLKLQSYNIHSARLMICGSQLVFLGNLKEIDHLKLPGLIIILSICRCFIALFLIMTINYNVYRCYDVQYLDDGKTEKGVPRDELRLTTEMDRQSRSAPPLPLPLPLEGLLDICGSVRENQGPESMRTPRAVIHDNQVGGDVDNRDASSNVFIIEGQQKKLGVGGGMRGIRFLRNSTHT
jgi:hypothetical protein